MDRKELEDECNEQARLNGMGAEREARLMAEVERLRAERDALAKDAARYRWLRVRWGRTGEIYDSDTGIMIEIGDDPCGWTTDAESLDRCIDAAMDEGER